MKSKAMRRAHRAVQTAIERGYLRVPLICSRCWRARRLHAHHHDYRKKLEVEFICVPCHAAEHRK